MENTLASEIIHNLKHIIIVLIICWLVSIGLLVGVFVWYENQFEYGEITTTEIDTDTGNNSSDNNIEIKDISNG